MLTDYKPAAHWTNTAFKILAFQVNSCNTPDGAFCKLYVEYGARKRALDEAMVNLKRNKAKRMRLELALAESGAEGSPDRLEAEADLESLTNNEALNAAAIAGCIAEMSYLQQLMNLLKEDCLYVDKMDISDVFQASEYEEWRLELIKRAQNFMLSIGHIPADQFEAMRGHPAFQSDIWPVIAELKTTGQVTVSTPAFVAKLHLALASEVFVKHFQSIPADNMLR
jgi:hypothetical protein